MFAIQTEVSDGTLSTINVGIEFFQQSDISVSLDLSAEPLVPGVDYQWSAATTVKFLNSALTPGGLVPTGVTVIVRRNTQNSEMYNTYDGGAPFSRLTLDENFEQLLRLAQEFSEGLGISGIQQALDLHGYRITNLGNAQADSDAMNLGQAKDLFLAKLGGAMLGILSLGGYRLVNVGVPELPSDGARKLDVDNEGEARAAADAELRAEMMGTVPPLASAFSVISWHPQTIDASVSIPPGMNAWSFGPQVAIAPGQVVEVGDGSFWTIASGATTQEGPLVAELPATLDMGTL